MTMRSCRQSLQLSTVLGLMASHQVRLHIKLGLRTRANLVRCALRAGLVRFDEPPRLAP